MRTGRNTWSLHVLELEHSRTFLCFMYLYYKLLLYESVSSYNRFVELLLFSDPSHVLCQLHDLTLLTGYGPSTRMAESKMNVAIVPLNGANCPTWKVQCRMALVRDGLWGIVSGTETVPTEGGDRRSNFLARRDRALATIVLAVEPSLLYLIGDPGRRPRCCLAEATESVPKEDMGQ